MTKFYLDVSAVGNEYQAYADTPASWAVPQDGNGKAASASSAAVPVCEVTFAAVPTSGAISVMGVTVTLTGVLSAASTAAAATALASSINATTTATGSAVCKLTLPLSRFVYARVKPGGGGNDSIVQIMCRMAGSDLNYPANSSARVTNTFNNSAMTSPVDFSGGVDGPWGYLTNDTSKFGKSQGGYGLLTALSPTPTDPTTGDCIVCRTKRSGSDLTVTITASTTLNVLMPNGSRVFAFDDGTDWSGDNGQLTLSLDTAFGYNIVFGPTTGTAAFEAKARYGFRLLCKTGSGYTAFIGPAGGSLLRLCGVIVEAYDSSSGISFQHPSYYYATGVTFVRSKILYRKVQSLFSLQSAYDTHYRLLDSTLEWVGIGSNVSSVFVFGAPSNQSPPSVWFENVDFIVDGGAYSVTGLASAAGASSIGNSRVSVQNCRGIVNPSLGLPASISRNPFGAMFTWQDDATYSFRRETCYLTCEYVSSSNPPSLGVTTPAGTLMSYRFTWESARLDWSHQHEVGVFRKFFKDTAATKTLAIEMLVPTAEIPTDTQIGAIFTYTDSGGVLRQESTFPHSAWSALGASSGSALPAGVGTGSWALNGLSGVSSVKLQITTANAVMQNTEISVKLLVVGPPTGTRVIYVSPEVRIS